MRFSFGVNACFYTSTAVYLNWRFLQELQAFLCNHVSVELPESKRKHALSLDWNLRNSNGLFGRHASGSRPSGYWIGRECLSANVDDARRPEYYDHERLRRGASQCRARLCSSWQRDSPRQSGSRRNA